MNERPTPETDAFFRSFADGDATPSHAEYYDRMTQLERERDEARIEAIEQARLLGMSGEREAKLITERDESLRLLEKWEQVAIGAGERVLELTKQRDKLAEAIRLVLEDSEIACGHFWPDVVKKCQESLAAVEGGKP